MVSEGVRASQSKWADPPPGLHSDCQDSAFCPFLPGQDAGRGSGGATQGTAWGWNRRARESPGQVSELDRTQLSQDLGGGTLAIDKLPDNGTRVVVSAGGTQRGREVVGGGSPGAPCKLVRATSVSFGVDPGGQHGERAPKGGDGSLAQPGSENLSISELHRLPTSLWTQRGAVTCSRMHSITTGFKTLDSSMS